MWCVIIAIPGISGTKDDNESFIRVCINNLCSLSSRSTDAFLSTAGLSIPFTVGYK